ncbi:MAG: hypothetical protein HFI36_03135 [Bacilli bacterium]|nr:hypothetical protein [Bacilli bacterium]
MMENREYLNNLFDIYKNLLTKIEQETFINYYGEDLTLSEIAENRGISKSSVGKTLNNVEDKLKQYEESLKIFSFKNDLKEILELNDINKIKNKLKNLINE